ncbi:HU family DNA-binding protein [uncultured Duncaniella sp.]|nr:HU family DNA-binding protein [uncultured Duncaniella sp.]
MNRKIPFHELASLLAANCNISSEEAEEFIKSFFDLTTQALSEGESLRIKGIGAFELSDDKDDPIIFTPDESIAETINAPFALFEPEEICDNISEEALAEIMEDGTKGAISQSESEPQAESTTEPLEETMVEATEIDNPVEDPSSKPEEETETTIEAEAETITDEPLVPETTDEPEPKHETESEIAPNVVAEDTNEVAAATTETAVATKSEAVTVTKPETTITVGATEKPTYPTQVITPFPEEEPEEYIEPARGKSGGSFGWGFLVGILVGLAIGACGVYLAIDYLVPTNTPSENVEEVAADDIASEEEVQALIAEAEAVLSDTIAAAPIVSPEQAQIIAESNPQANETLSEPAPQKEDVEQKKEPAPQPQNKIVKDKVRSGYLLHDMAKKHYGNKCFWVYIYEENKSKITNPNRVSPGLELVIPAAEKYGINASSSASVNAANAKASKILTKYPR